MKRLLLTALACLGLAACIPAEADAVDNGKPQAAITELLISDCAQEGYLIATTEDGIWTLRYIHARVNSGDFVSDLSPDEVVVYDSYRENYDIFKEYYLYEMCKSFDIDNAVIRENFKFVEEPTK